MANAVEQAMHALEHARVLLGAAQRAQQSRSRSQQPLVSMYAGTSMAAPASPVAAGTPLTTAETLREGDRASLVALVEEIRRENATLRAEIASLRTNLGTKHEVVAGSVLRMRSASQVANTPISSTPVIVEAAPVCPLPTDEDLRKADYTLILCTERHGCEFIKPGSRGIRMSQQSNNVVKMVWDERPRCVLILKKPFHPPATAALISIARFLLVRRAAPTGSLVN